MSDQPQSKSVSGVGLDIGTMNIVSARRGADKVKTKRVRDAFIDVEKSKAKHIKMGGQDLIEREDDILVVGDDALDVANLLGRECRRPLQSGLIAAGEFDAMDVLAVMIKQVLGPPQVEDEICYYSIPAAPVDDLSRDVVFHKGVFKRIVTECGYDAIPSNEALAIIFAEAAQDEFSGIGISFGAGMCNVALALRAIEGLTFSVARGGDWIDHGAAKSTGATAAAITAIKESGEFNLMEQGGDRKHEALTLYYRELIDYCLDHFAREFAKVAGKFQLPGPVPIIVSGGTSKANGFLEFFTQVFEKRRKRFPIEVSEVRHASEPLNAVARGLMVQANAEYAE